MIRSFLVILVALSMLLGGCGSASPASTSTVAPIPTPVSTAGSGPILANTAIPTQVAPTATATQPTATMAPVAITPTATVAPPTVTLVPPTVTPARVLPAPTATSTRMAAAPTSTPVPVGDIVYITKSGTKYHRAGCSSLAKSQIPIERSEAIARGYTACSICKP